MPDEPHVCIDRVLSTDRIPVAADRATRETDLNVPLVRSDMGIMPLTSFELAVLTGKKWQNGRTIRVAFLDGDDAVKSKVEAFARAWEPHANLRFDFVRGPDADIRISFLGRGSWSYLGTDALAIPAGEATMNYGWLTPTTADDEYSRVVIHEFGHALGAVHEHQNPAAEIPWDRESVYRYYAGPPNHWSREQVDLNLFQRYGRDVTQFSAFDQDSVMLYPIPREHTLGGFEVGFNRELSGMDKSFMATLYPRARTSVTRLAVGGEATRAAIGRHREEDLYEFEVREEGPHTLETTGPTNVTMGLLGPDDPTRLLALDDDSGQDRNARIAMRLKPGNYRVRVRHFHATGTGEYSIGVRPGSPRGPRRPWWRPW